MWNRFFGNVSDDVPLNDSLVTLSSRHITTRNTADIVDLGLSVRPTTSVDFNLTSDFGSTHELLGANYTWTTSTYETSASFINRTINETVQTTINTWTNVTSEFVRTIMARNTGKLCY